jgi:hypothetical protein
MKKTTISISYNDEKLSAIRMFLSQKDMNLEAELTYTVDTLYKKYVPSGVRDFIDMKDSDTIKKPKTRLAITPEHSRGVPV